jgi:hypothetical protein
VREARGGAGAAPRNLLRWIISFHWPSRGSMASTELPRAAGVGGGQHSGPARVFSQRLNTPCVPPPY